MNGPMSSLVKPTAIAATTRLAAVAPGCKKRSAAQISSGKTRYARLVSRENTSALTPTVAAASAIASSGRPGTRVNGLHVAATRRNGAISRSPPMSPSHHTRHTDAKLSTSSVVAARLATPIVAADRGAHRAREDHEREDVAHTLEGGPEMRDAQQEVRPDDGLERVPGRDPDRGDERYPGPRVGQERPERHTRPEPGTAEHERGERQPGRRPDRRHARGLEREAQPELGSAVVGGGQDRDARSRPPPAL